MFTQHILKTHKLSVFVVTNLPLVQHGKISMLNCATNVILSILENKDLSIQRHVYRNSKPNNKKLLITRKSSPKKYKIKNNEKKAPSHFVKCSWDSSSPCGIPAE